MFWAEKEETVSRDELRSIQTDRLGESVERAGKSPYYRKLYGKHNLKLSIKSLEDIRKFPFTTKDDLRASYPVGMMAVPMDNIVRMHASSGTTGKSTLVFHTIRDIENWSNLVARGLYSAGVRKSDVFQNMMSYGLFTGGLGLHYGAEKIGALVIPIGAGNTQKQIDFFNDMKTTVIHITPSYLLHLGYVLEEKGLAPSKSFSIKIAIMGAEPHSEATRKKLEEIFNIKVYNCYGLSEMNGPGVAFECACQKGLHLWEDHYLAEIINPETGEVLPEGEEGELVLTTLQREGMPIIRYRTKDITKFISGKCKCGRTHRRIARMKGRTDDMFIVKGVNIFPSQIETVLMETPEVDKNYMIVLDRKEGLDILSVQIEIKKDYFRGDLNQLKYLQENLREKLKHVILVTPVIELVEPGSLPSSTGKAQRVIDKRRL
ncbi:MAG TPA: phenylacetate--CoA ligase [bacterium]|nr:phenylacetate--CoA ligase [bacterium]